MTDIVDANGSQRRRGIVPRLRRIRPSSLTTTPIRTLGLAVCLAAILTACAGSGPVEQPSKATGKLLVATFAGGCFWCVEADFEKVPGVEGATSGYTGGWVPDPSYRQVSNGTTGHRESVLVHYDPATVSYENLLQAFWRMIDPTDTGGQFGDRGMEYTTAIWYHSEKQRETAETSKAALDASGRYAKPVATPILPATRFYPAETYHQDYYKRNPLRYRYYRHFSGRDRYLEGVWGSDSNQD